MKRVVFFRRKASWGWCEPSTEEKMKRTSEMLLERIVEKAEAPCPRYKRESGS